jgi:tRNA pseudouridine55 synthase
VDAIRRKFGIKKVGHCGTLDPNATGLLIIVLGRGTKLSERLMGDDKVYEGTIKFGETTDSYDADGELTGSLPLLPMTLEQLNTEAATFIGWFRRSRRTACRFTSSRAKASKSSASRV